MKVDEIPFDFERRRMSVVLNTSKGKHLMISKGAVEEMLSLCKYALDPETIIAYILRMIILFR